jgi:hypothetical protein
MAVELVRTVNEHDKSVPADMLLMRERARKLRAPESTAIASIPAIEADLLLEGDALVESPGQPELASPPSGALALFRPLSSVTIGAIAWSGTVDHELLQNAIICAPARTTDSLRPPAWLSAVVNFTLAEMPGETPALHALLSVDDLALLGRIGMRHSRESALALARAAALPSSIVGTDAATAHAAAGALSGYRRAALVYSWQGALHGVASSDAARDRDASAIELLSTLRAVLGEI